MSRPLLKITDHVLGVEAQVLSDLDEGNLLAVDPMVDGLHGYAEEICDFRGTEEFLDGSGLIGSPIKRSFPVARYSSTERDIQVPGRCLVGASK
jgi:hypothetical protein